MYVCNLWESKSEWVEYVICVPEKSHRICRPLQLVWQLGFYPLNSSQWQEHHHKQRLKIAGAGLILAWYNFPASLCNELRWIAPWCPCMVKRQKAMEKLIEREREKKKYLLEISGIGRPLRHIFVQRTTLKSKIVPPIVNLFLVRIKTCRKSHCLWWVIRVYNFNSSATGRLKNSVATSNIFSTASEDTPYRTHPLLLSHPHIYS